MVNMPRVTIKPSTEEGVVDVELSRPERINPGSPSYFPLEEDVFKNLDYQTASQSDLNRDMKSYYDVMSKIMGGTASAADITNLETITSKIRDYVLTDDDYNLMVGALQNMQAYVLRFMYTDITNKSKAMDTELNKVIDDINRFMKDLETTYSKSPSSYPIPNNSVQKPKLEASIQKAINYGEGTQSAIFSASKPANPEGRAFIWFNTGDRI